MNNTKRAWLAIVLVVVLGGSATLIHELLPPRYHSSPTAPRNTAGYDSHGIGGFVRELTDFEDAEFSQAGSIELSIPEKLTGADRSKLSVPTDATVLKYSELENQTEISVPRTTLKLPEGAELHLKGVAVWVPQPDDPVIPTDDWTAAFHFCDPKSGELLAADQLIAAGVPEEWLELKFDTSAEDWEELMILYSLPRMRFIFHTENLPVIRTFEVEGSDARTGAQLTLELEFEFGVSDWFQRSGDWISVDTAALYYHDTPIDLRIEFLAGEPSYAELPRRLGAQVELGDHLRLQWLGEVSGGVNSWANGTYLTPREDGEQYIALRTNGAEFAREHCGIITKDGIEWDWRAENEYLISRRLDDDSDPMKLVSLPSYTVLEYRIETTPGMPNGRDVENLFDVRIPRLTLDGDDEMAEDILLAIIACAVEAGWDYDHNFWIDDGRMAPSALPEDRTFRDTTPQQLLNWYVKHTPNASVNYEEKEFVIYFNHSCDSWVDSVRGWLMEKRESIWPERPSIRNLTP